MGAPIQYKSGDNYNGLVLTGKAFIEKGHRVVEYLCKCDGIFYVRLSSLLSGNTKSCGCLKNEFLKNEFTIHGIYGHPLYHVWHGIRQRCYNPSKSEYPNYGGRGIGMCSEWQTDVMAFYNWAIQEGWKKGLTIERKKNNEDYSPSNCKIATMGEQSRNKRSNVMVTAFGEIKCVTDWAKDSRCKIGKHGLWDRIKNGWDHELAITTLSLNINRKKQKNGIT